MPTIRPPKYALEVLRRIDTAGERAYFVGGCIRDMLLGRRPWDWDICSSSAPEKIMELFPRCYPTGIKHGTVTVIHRNRPLEVTTFRTDGPYTDGRHPQNVSFVRDLESDLSRRDFTINAMAMDAEGRITDLFGGQDDLAAGIIRCVGDPEKRFSEDALRMFRALRFSSQLGFEVEARSLEAITRLSHLSRGLSAERIRTELEKTLCSPHPDRIGDMLRAGLVPNARFSGSPNFKKLSALPKTGAVRWAALCSLLAENGCVESPSAFLTPMRLDGATLKTAVKAAELALKDDISGPENIKRLLAKTGADVAEAAAASMDLLYGPGHTEELRRVQKSGECCSLGQLEISGSQLKAMGFEGPETGAALQALLEHVIVCPQDNQPEILKKLALAIK